MFYISGQWLPAFGLRSCKRCFQYVVIGTFCTGLATGFFDKQHLFIGNKWEPASTRTAASANSYQADLPHTHTHSNTDPVEPEGPASTTSGSATIGGGLWQGSGRF